MLVLLTIIDDLYPKSKVMSHRDSARGIILNNLNEVAVLEIKCVDIFGVRDHFELPGGGIEKDESPLETLKREIKEEVGVSIKNIIPIGIVEYEYNLLKRKEKGYFYLAFVDKYFKQKLTKDEESFIVNLKWIQIDQLIEILSTRQVENVGRIIHRRDLFILKEAKKILSII